MLAADGWDIKIVKRKPECNSYNKISWKNSEEGRKGTITYIDRTQQQDNKLSENYSKTEEVDTMWDYW